MSKNRKVTIRSEGATVKVSASSSKKDWDKIQSLVKKGKIQSLVKKGLSQEAMQEERLLKEKEMKQRLQKRFKRAVNQTESLTADMFEQQATINHLDGSRYYIAECIARVEGEFFVVLPEHGFPIVFHVDDLKDYDLSQACTKNCDLCEGKGWNAPDPDLTCCKCNGTGLIKR